MQSACKSEQIVQFFEHRDRRAVLVFTRGYTERLETLGHYHTDR